MLANRVAGNADLRRFFEFAQHGDGGESVFHAAD